MASKIYINWFVLNLNHSVINFFRYSTTLMLSKLCSQLLSKTKTCLLRSVCDSVAVLNYFSIQSFCQVLHWCPIVHRPSINHHFGQAISTFPNESFLHNRLQVSDHLLVLHLFCQLQAIKSITVQVQHVGSMFHNCFNG